MSIPVNHLQTGTLPLLVAEPEDTTFTYARRLVFAYWQAGRRNEHLEDDDLDRAARQIATEFRKLSKRI